MQPQANWMCTLLIHPLHTGPLNSVAVIGRICVTTLELSLLSYRLESRNP